MIIEIITQVMIVILVTFSLLFCGFVAIYLGKTLFLGYIYEFKAKRYIKNKYPKYKIDYLNQEVLQNSVLCELHTSGDRLFGSLKFRKGKMINELEHCDW